MLNLKEQKFFNFIVYFYVTFTFLSNIELIDNVLPFFKYLKYFSFIFAVYLYFKFKFLNNVNSQVLPFLLLLLSTIVRLNQLYLESLYNIVFYLSGIILFINSRKLIFPARKAFMLSALLGIIFIFSYSSFSDISYKLIYLKIFETPSSLSYIFGFLTIFFLLDKDYKYMILSLLFLFLLPKRLVLNAVVFLIILSFLPGFVKRIFNWRWMLVVINIIYLLFTIYLASGLYDEILIRLTDLQPGQFTSGRTTIYSYVILKSKILEGLNWIFGLGDGYSVSLLKGNFGGIYLVHNDILKIFIDHGVIILVIFSYLLFLKGNYKQKMITFYYNILLFADNTLVYSFAFVFYLIIWSHFSIGNFTVKSEIHK